MEKEIEVIATIWVNTNSDGPPTILKSRPLVRCKDCMYKEKTQPGMVYCPNMVGGWVDEDWFCAGGTSEDGYCHLGEKKE